MRRLIAVSVALALLGGGAALADERQNIVNALIGLDTARWLCPQIGITDAKFSALQQTYIDQLGEDFRQELFATAQQLYEQQKRWSNADTADFCARTAALAAQAQVLQ